MAPLNQGVLALRHKFLHLGKDTGRHLSNGKLQPIVLRPGKLADATPVREALFKTSEHISPTPFTHRLVSEDVLGHAGTQNPDIDPFDSKAVIDVEYVPMPHRSGAEAQQRPHLLGNRLLIAVWNALDRPFETLEARMATRMPAPWKYVAGPHFHGAGMHSVEKEATQKRASAQPNPYPGDVANAVKSFTNALRF